MLMKELKFVCKFWLRECLKPDVFVSEAEYDTLIFIFLQISCTRERSLYLAINIPIAAMSQLHAYLQAAVLRIRFHAYVLCLRLLHSYHIFFSIFFHFSFLIKLFPFPTNYFRRTSRLTTTVPFFILFCSSFVQSFFFYEIPGCTKTYRSFTRIYFSEKWKCSFYSGLESFAKKICCFFVEKWFQSVMENKKKARQ